MYRGWLLKAASVLFHMQLSVNFTKSLLPMSPQQVFTAYLTPERTLQISYVS